MTTKTTKKKSPRRQLSGERTLALELVELIESCQTGDNVKITAATGKANDTLKALGYDGLESIASRVAKVEAQLQAAIKGLDGKEVARLGAELSRAQRGLSPITKASPKANAATE